VEIPTGVSALDMKDPTNMLNMWCMSYLDLFIAQTKKEMTACSAREEPLDKNLRARYLECMKRKGQVKNSIESGDMSLEDYVE
jgi:hypothetical protein